MCRTCGYLIKNGKSFFPFFRNFYCLGFLVYAPIGSLREKVIDELERILIDQYKYAVKRLKLSDFIKKYVIPTETERTGETKAYTYE
jgi:hypothetical protein